MKSILSILILVLSEVTLANEAAHGAHSNEIPSVIIWQVINLGILFAIIYKYTKQPIVEFFSSRQKDYLAQAEKSQALFKDAEKQYLDIQHRLEVLNSSSEESINKAKQEALDLKNQMIKDAEELAARIKDEAKQAAKIESQKVYQKLHDKIVSEAIMAAKNVLTRDIGAQDHQKLQSDFNKNIEAVHP
jgi:F-type H+-transporting ATPase subunit b